MFAKYSVQERKKKNHLHIFYFTVSNRLLELSERYVRAGLSHSVPLTVRLVEEYNKGFESRCIEYTTPLIKTFTSAVNYVRLKRVKPVNPITPKIAIL
ncbi:hypothetical protein BpHYR1_012054 [Brachionus plicatilis]|uniref:Uncharacterized protein n=1 Tax=Brachionus plicatilis TaxID=10195 RepID=A0A3M7SVQ7_BRAPC|nr:hypothetical protein BpHYR1_012054 [Brachionus plicatilis]